MHANIYAYIFKYIYINHQADTFKEHFRQAHFNIQLCNIDVTLVTLSARRVASSTAVFV